MASVAYQFFLKHIRLILSCTLIIFVLAGGSVFIAHSQPTRAFAAALGQTCAQSPSMDNCNNQDPEIQGCAADAQTIAQSEITENGFTIGSVERRYSPVCRSWWGRVFDKRVGSQANMFIAIDGTTLSAAPTFVSGQYRILYSSMIFNSNPAQQVPSITGTLEIDGIIKAPDATLPAITIPGH